MATILPQIPPPSSQPASRRLRPLRPSPPWVSRSAPTLSPVSSKFGQRRVGSNTSSCQSPEHNCCAVDTGRPWPEATAGPQGPFHWDPAAYWTVVLYAVWMGLARGAQTMLLSFGAAIAACASTADASLAGRLAWGYRTQCQHLGFAMRLGRLDAARWLVSDGGFKPCKCRGMMLRLG